MQTLTAKDAVAEKLIEWHFSVDSWTTEIYRFFTPNEDDPREPIKLLEISSATMPTGEVMTFGFAPAEDITYPSVIAEVTPEEMNDVRHGRIALPSGWNLQTAKHYPRP